MNRPPNLHVALLLLLGVLVPRLCVLGAFPYMDEGLYLANAQQIALSLVNNGVLPNSGPCNFYALLLAPAALLPGNIFVWARLIDLCCALVAGWLLCRAVWVVSRGDRLWALPALLLLLGLNADAVIQAGAKNSFFAAFIPLLCSAFLAVQKSRARLFWAGFCMACAVLMRETFVVYALLAPCALWLAFSWRAAFLFCLGGCTGGVLLFGMLGFLRGGLATLISSYVGSGTIFAAEAERVWANFFHYGGRFCLEFWPILLLTLAALVVLWRDRATSRGKIAFFFALLLAPLPESMSKISYLYHFSLMLPGMIGLLALGLSGYRRLCPKGDRPLLWVLVGAVLCVFVTAVSWHTVPLTVAVLRNAPSFDWPAHVRASSNTLRAADEIAKLPGKTLVVSGFLHFLYPASRRVPPTFELDDLSRVYLLAGKNVDTVRARLLAHPPDVIAIGRTEERDHVAMFTEELSACVESTGRYVRVAVVPTAPSLVYGWIGCDIYARVHE